ASRILVLKQATLPAVPKLEWSFEPTRRMSTQEPTPQPHTTTHLHTSTQHSLFSKTCQLQWRGVLSPRSPSGTAGEPRPIASESFTLMEPIRRQICPPMEAPGPS